MIQDRSHFPRGAILATLPTADRFPPLPDYAQELLAEFTNPPLRSRDVS